MSRKQANQKGGAANVKVLSARFEALVGNASGARKPAIEASKMSAHWQVHGNAALALALAGDTAIV